MEDLELLGTSIAVLANANPAVSLVIGVLSGFFGKLFFDKATKPSKKKENKEMLEKILQAREK